MAPLNMYSNMQCNWSQWKRINCKPSARWQHLSRLKASTFLLENYFVRCWETQQLILEIGNTIWWVIEPHWQQKDSALKYNKLLSKCRENLWQSTFINFFKQFCLPFQSCPLPTYLCTHRGVYKNLEKTSMDWRSNKKIFFSSMSLSSHVIRIVHAMVLFLLCFIFINKNRLNKKISQVTWVNVEFISKRLQKI
jgi:hypothetical protein